MDKQEFLDTLNDAEQKKRFDSACSAECTPASVDRDTLSGTFRAHAVHGTYRTSLDACTCHDYKIRKLPCKHMYRLALELGVLEGKYDSYLHGGYTWTQAVDLIEKYPESVQEEFLFRLRNTKTHPDGYRRKASAELDTLIADGIIEEVGKPSPKFRTVRLILDFYHNYTKLYRYFSRKFCPPSNLCVLPDGSFDDFVSYPNDDVSALLVAHGFVDPKLVGRTPDEFDY